MRANNADRVIWAKASVEGEYMCGICGILNLEKENHVNEEVLKQMVFMLRHRGPEEFGIYRDSKIGLGHARLSIIDLKSGRQPIHNEDKTIWIVLNGEIFNYVELKKELISKGHQFYTQTDTEVIVHLYEEKGEDFLKSLNGQFSLALWDSKNRQLLLARDRVGIRPLFYTEVDNSLIFGSEIKSIFIDRRVKREIDPRGLEELFTFWATIPARTTFKYISELPPAHYLIVKGKRRFMKRYWDLTFSTNIAANFSRGEDDYSQRLLYLIKDAIGLRLRADVPVAAYLSGGLDSSFISALVKKHFNDNLQTFSVSFTDQNYDESSFQQQMSTFLGTVHNEISCSSYDIGKVIPDIVWHSESPLIRTAPAPLFLLSKLVRDKGIKVVLTGEGADEILAGYDLFREMKIRRFWAKYPASKRRPLLLKKLYHYLPDWPRRASVFLESFYKSTLSGTEKTYYSHIPRWKTSSQVKTFFSERMRNELEGYDSISEFEKQLPKNFGCWDYLAKAQSIEIISLLSGNLLSSQGDRMMMAHSVEGRLPFLDHRVIEFCGELPSNLKLKILNEKYILKKIAKPFLPLSIIERTKQAYRAPDSASFFGGKKLDYVEELLSTSNLTKTGYFNPIAVRGLIKRCKDRNNPRISARYNMAVVGVLTTLLCDKMFIRDFDSRIEKDNKAMDKIIIFKGEENRD